MSIYKKWAVNIANNNGEVQLIESRIKIPAGQCVGLTSKDIEHSDVVDAQARGWIVLLDEEPKTTDAPKAPTMEFEVPAEAGAASPVEAEKKEKKAEATRKAEAAKQVKAKPAEEKEKVLADFTPLSTEEAAKASAKLKEDLKG